MNPSHFGALSYGKTNLTSHRLTPMPEVGASTIDSSRGMKVAMKRKINPIARRQENIYDLHGRPLYLGAGGTVMVVESSSSRSPPR